MIPESRRLVAHVQGAAFAGRNGCSPSRRPDRDSESAPERKRGQHSMLRRSISSYRGTRRVKESQLDAYAQFPSSEEPTAKELAPEEPIYYLRANFPRRENILCTSATTHIDTTY